jgi:hypothetical protein
MQNKDQIVKELSDLMIRYSLGNIYCGGSEGIIELRYVDKAIRHDGTVPAKINVTITPTTRTETLVIST